MKRTLSIALAILLTLACVSVLVACQGELVDYASQLTLDIGSETAKMYATPKTYIDGDTTHFNVSESNVIKGELTDMLKRTGVLKARYLAINTPESTGQIEPYGKTASNFTKEKLTSATSIILESDTATWNVDSTGGRYTVWIWYKTAEMTEYRNLNLEILQAGLAWGSNSGGNRYGDICMSALDQAQSRKLYVFSDAKDPNFYYGEYQQVTLKALRTNIDSYVGTNVAVEGVVVSEGNNTVYIQEYDEENDMFFGIAVYYGYKLDPGGKRALAIGNRVRVAGSVQYYEAGGTYQISDVNYDAYDTDNIKNIKVLQKAEGVTYRLTTVDEFFGDNNVNVIVDDETLTFNFREVAVSTAIEMRGLKVKSISTTSDPDSSNFGAMTLYCTVTDSQGKSVEITVRTAVLSHEDGTLYTRDDIGIGTTINPKGIIDYYQPDYEGGKPIYQIKVLTFENLGIVK